MLCTSLVCGLSVSLRKPMGGLCQLVGVYIAAASIEVVAFNFLPDIKSCGFIRQVDFFPGIKNMLEKFFRTCFVMKRYVSNFLSEYGIGYYVRAFIFFAFYGVGVNHCGCYLLVAHRLSYLVYRGSLP